MSQRQATVKRETLETQIEVTVNLDGQGNAVFETGVPFLDHMLDQVARHGMLDLEIRASGDLHIDAHHTVEDIGITLGQAMSQAVADKRGIRRYGECHLPMDDAQVRAALLNNYDIEIGAGLGPLAGKIWRIGLMGHSSRAENVIFCLSALEAVLGEMNAPINRGVALSAAQAVYSG